MCDLPKSVCVYSHSARVKVIYFPWDLFAIINHSIFISVRDPPQAHSTEKSEPEDVLMYVWTRWWSNNFRSFAINSIIYSIHLRYDMDVRWSGFAWNLIIINLNKNDVTFRHYYSISHRITDWTQIIFRRLASEFTLITLGHIQQQIFILFVVNELHFPVIHAATVFISMFWHAITERRVEKGRIPFAITPTHKLKNNIIFFALDAASLIRFWLLVCNSYASFVSGATRRRHAYVSADS